MENTDLCHPMDGSCDCVEGFTGAACNSPCLQPYFGKNCKRILVFRLWVLIRYLKVTNDVIAHLKMEPSVRPMERAFAQQDLSEVFNTFVVV